MANTDTEIASREQVRQALGIINDLQATDPNQLEGLLRKHPEANLFNEWPFHKKEAELFLGLFGQTTVQPSEQGAETVTQPPGPYAETVTGLPGAQLGSQRAVDAKKLEDLEEVFNREIVAAKDGRVKARSAAEQFVQALKKQARESSVQLPEAQPIAATGEEGAPVPEESVGHMAAAAMQQPGPPEQKELIFHALTWLGSENPNKSVDELLPRAVDVALSARVMTVPKEEFIPQVSFSSLAGNEPYQKGVAAVLNVIVPTAIKKVAIDQNLLRQLDALANHPEMASKALMGEMVNRWGEDFVNSSWFDKLRTDANHILNEQKSVAGAVSGITSVITDISAAVFHNHEALLTYTETGRIVFTQGVVMADFSGYRSSMLGYGKQLLGMGANYAVRAGIKAGVKRAAAGTAAKAIGGAALGVGTAGTGTLIALGLDALNTLKNKALGAIMGILGMKDAKLSFDKWLLIIGVGIVLVFLIPVSPLLSFAGFGMGLFDMSLATSLSGGTGGGSVTLSCANTNGIYLSQGNPSWGSLPYGSSSCTIAGSACGPTSVTMILNAFGSSPPATVSKSVGEVLNAGKFQGCYSTDAANVKVLKSHNLSVTNIFTSCTEASNFLKACGLILAQGTSHRPARDVEHYIVITGISCRGDTAVSYDTLDPAYHDGPWNQTPATFTIETMYSVVNPAKVQ